MKAVATVVGLMTICPLMLLSQEVGLGTISPSSTLHIKGVGNMSQVIVQANNTQSNINPLIFLRQYNGDGLFDIHSDVGSNTFIGRFAGKNNFYLAGTNNTFVGGLAGYYNFNGMNNTGVGFRTLYLNSSGNANTALGYQALWGNVSGRKNSALGYNALYANNQDYNTGIGAYALYATTNGSYNVAVGYKAGRLFNNGWNNTFIGAEADVAAAGFYNVVALGNIATCTDVNQCRIGNSATYSIGGYEAWTNISDARFKKNIQANVVGLSFINKLRPVTYTLDVYAVSAFLNENRGHEMNPYLAEALKAKAGEIESGFIAQEVEAAARAVGYDFSGIDAPQNEYSLYGLRYAEFVVPLVKAVQELQQKLEILKRENVELKELEAELNTLKERYALINNPAVNKDSDSN